jgi:acyl-CoA synthetase (AMP-forming)/AMP-acid ligase II
MDWGRRRGSVAAVQWLDAGGQRAGEMTYGQLAQRMQGVAAAVARHLAPGAVVMLAGPNGGDWIAAYLGILAAGGVVFPVPAEAVAEELRAAAQRSAAAGVIGDERVMQVLGSAGIKGWRMEEMGAEQGQNEAAGEPGQAGAMLLQSSGTTGLPKIVRREAAALDAVAENMVLAVGFSAEDVVLATLPLCHSYGVEHGLLAPMWAGSCVRFTHAFDPPVVL